MTAASRKTVSKSRTWGGLATRTAPADPCSRRPAFGITATTIARHLATLLLAGAAAAQVASPRVVTTPDGSRFLLYPTGGPPVLSWVMRTPAGPAEERDGEQGLAFAVARAAMAGTTTLGSIDGAAEQDLLQRWDADEQRLAQITLAGQAVPSELTAAIDAHRSAAGKLADPLAFERALRAAPCRASHLSQTPQAMLLHLELAVEAVARVADLLVARREDAVLRGLHDELRAVRAELARANASDEWAPARDEMRWLAYRGHPLGRPSLGVAHVPVGRARAREVFATTHRPERTRHVLVGGFDPDAVAAALMAAFAHSDLPQDPLPLAPAIADPRGEVTGRIAGGSFAGLAVAYRTPPGADAAAVALAATWLADGEASFLARTLRANGIGAAAVTVTHPFPAASAAPFVLIEVRADARQSRDAATQQALVVGVDTALSAASRTPPTAAELVDVRARLTARHGQRLRNPATLATHLALLWDDGVTDPHLVAAPDAPNDAAVIATLKGMLVRDRRVRVTQEMMP